VGGDNLPGESEEAVAMSHSSHKQAEAVRVEAAKRFQREARVVADEEREVPLPFPEGEVVVEVPAGVRLYCGDVLDVLRAHPPGTVSCVITSPPYYGLRSYGIPPRVWADGETCVLGEERTLDGYLTHLVEVFREVKRVLHPRGTCWLNLGDCYAGGGKHVERREIYNIPSDAKPSRPKQRNLTGKDLLLVPARAALALQGDGWILRNDIIWAKAVSFLPSFSGSVMPESTRDRATWAHEHIFHLALREDYFYDQDACREAFADSSLQQAQSEYRGRGRKDYASAGQGGRGVQNPSDTKRRVIAAIARAADSGGGRNLRNVWVIPKQNFPGAHFATFPERLVEPIIKLAASERGVCSSCYSPIQRRTVREEVPADVRAAFEASRAATATDTGRTDGHTSRRPNHRRKVLREEWEPSCSCAAGVQPATVLDIFNGSGRTGIVARRLGRSYEGIDANAEYVRMAETYINAATPRSHEEER
jgi:DNA modification methylase